MRDSMSYMSRSLSLRLRSRFFFFFQAEDGIRDIGVTGVQTCALPILITAVLIPLQIIVFIAWPPPLEGSVTDWFRLFQDNWLLGLLSLDLLLLVDYVLLVPIVLALYVALRQISASLMAVATALYFVAIAAYFASNTAFEMLSLSDQYAAATTDAQRAMYRVAGQTMLATFEGTAFQVSYVLASVRNCKTLDLRFRALLTEGGEIGRAHV